MFLTSKLGLAAYLLTILLVKSYPIQKFLTVLEPIHFSQYHVKLLIFLVGLACS